MTEQFFQNMQELHQKVIQHTATNEEQAIYRLYLRFERVISHMGLTVAQAVTMCRMPLQERKEKIDKLDNLIAVGEQIIEEERNGREN